MPDYRVVDIVERHHQPSLDVHPIAETQRRTAVRGYVIVRKLMKSLKLARMSRGSS
jgi:hypothetical protein